MELVDRVGRFKGNVLDYGVTKTKNGYPQYVLRLAATAYYDEADKEWVDWSETEQGITAYLCMFGSDGTATFNCKSIQDVIGWDGKSFAELAELKPPETIQFTVKDNEYDGNVTKQVNNIYSEDAKPSSIQKLDKKELKELDAMFAKGLQGVRKNVTPANNKSEDTSSPVKPPPTSKKKKQSTKIEAWQAAVEANKNGVQFDDEQLSELWVTTVADIAGDVDEEDINGKTWHKIKEDVVSALEE